MKLKPTPQQTFLILSMLFGETPDEREPRLDDRVVKALGVNRRKELERLSLIRTEKRGSGRSRRSYVVLDDAAWDFAFEHLGAELPHYRSPAPAKLLQRVLGRLRPFLSTHQHSLVDFVRGDSADDVVETDLQSSVSRDQEANDVNEQMVRDACLALAHNATRKRIRLSDLRKKLGVPRESLDRALRDMQVAGRLVLYKLDNPAEISVEDEHAALFIAGEPRHLVYLEA